MVTQERRTASDATPDRLSGVRVVTGWAVAAVAALLTGLTALAAYGASTEVYHTDLYWFVVAVVAVAAIVAWVTGLVLTRMTGWVLYVVAAVLVMLTAAAAYAAVQDLSGGPGLLVVALLTIPASVGAIIWNLTRAPNKHRATTSPSRPATNLVAVALAVPIVIGIVVLFAWLTLA